MRKGDQTCDRPAAPNDYNVFTCFCAFDQFRKALFRYAQRYCRQYATP